MAEKNIFPSLRREIKILHKILKIEGCIHFTDIIMDENSLSIVFPYYINGDLYKYSNPVHKPVEESVAQRVCFQLASTLMQLHKEGIIHRDLKPENILVGFNWKVYLADFGFAIYEKELKKENQYARVGTLEFYPIEMLSPCFRKDKITYDHRVDIWSMGIIIYELLYGRTPFYTGNEVDTKARIRSLKFTFPNKRPSNNNSTL